MSYEYLLLDVENHIATVTINRPPVNPLNSVVFKELGKMMDELDQRDDVRIIILTGSGDKAFVAGADVNEMANVDLTDINKMNKVSRSAFSKVENATKPDIAVINGVALSGGSETALDCEIRVSSEKMHF